MFLWRQGRFIWLRNSIVLIIMTLFASVIMSWMYKRCVELALILPHVDLKIIYKPLLDVVFGIFRTAWVREEIFLLLLFLLASIQQYPSWLDIILILRRPSIFPCDIVADDLLMRTCRTKAIPWFLHDDVFHRILSTILTQEETFSSRNA